jgi:hypothetical protein
MCARCVCLLGTAWFSPSLPCSDGGAGGGSRREADGEDDAEEDSDGDALAEALGLDRDGSPPSESTAGADGFSAPRGRSSGGEAGGGEAGGDGVMRQLDRYVLALPPVWRRP